MRASVLRAPGRIEIAEVEAPEPGPGQVAIRVEGCGVCASNLAPWQGQPWFEYPFPAGSPGHEGWGRVAALGPGVDGLDVGDRVAFLSGGAYAERDLAEAAHVVQLPAELDGRPFPGEPLGCAMNIFRRSEVEGGQTVAVVGIGFLGALLTRLLADAGVRVLAISRRPYSLEVARSMGAHEAIRFDDARRVAERVASLTAGEMCDRVIEAVGMQVALDVASQLTRVRGRLVIAGYHQDGPRQVDMQLWNWRGLDVINAHERDPEVYVRGIREALRAVLDGTLNPDPLFTHFPLERLGAALDATRDRPAGFLKAVVHP